jgi:hypothetical protein
LFRQTKAQVAIWENTGTLFGAIIQRYPDDYRAYYTLGKYQGEKEGKLEESIANNLKAIELGYKGDTGLGKTWEQLTESKVIRQKRYNILMKPSKEAPNQARLI